MNRLSSATDAADLDMPRASSRCRCGGDMPGKCPGPQFCPMCQPEPLCRVCGIWTSHRQDANATWICDGCAVSAPVEE